MNKVWIVARKSVGELGIFVRSGLKVVIVLGIFFSLVRSDVAQAHGREAILDRLLIGKEYDFVTWEANAILAKVGQEITLSQMGISDADRIMMVRGYMRRVSEYQRLESEINQMYINPDVKDPATASADQRTQRDLMRIQINARQNIVEAILQEQVESIFREEGFAVGGQIAPPLRFRFTELPDVIIISRRDKIERIAQRELTNGLTVDEFDRIEREVDRRLDVSSLVSPIGGLGAYPTMLPETSSLAWVIGVIAHEWVHNYLFFAPVGINYSDDPVARVINETTAELVEGEIGPRVLARYYPDLLPKPEPAASAPTPEPEKLKPADGPPAFDFRKEMRETRVHADELLAAGKIKEAESYMEARRVIFVKNGYGIRKLNQAYFAFHGAYNAEPGGAPEAGEDPIGPAVRALRDRLASVGDFLRAIARVSTLEDMKKEIGD